MATTFSLDLRLAVELGDSLPAVCPPEQLWLHCFDKMADMHRLARAVERFGATENMFACIGHEPAITALIVIDSIHPLCKGSLCFITRDARVAESAANLGRVGLRVCVVDAPPGFANPGVAKLTGAAGVLAEVRDPRPSWLVFLMWARRHAGKSVAPEMWDYAAREFSSF